MEGGCGDAPDNSWSPSDSELVDTYHVLHKLGNIGMEGERLKIDLWLDQEERIVAFSIIQETHHGGFKTVVWAHTANGTAHLRWYNQSANEIAGITEVLETIRRRDDVNDCFERVSEQMHKNWESNKLRWNGG